MAAQQPQLDSPTVDISVAKHGDVDVDVHVVPDASTPVDNYQPSTVDDERKMETQRQAWFENIIKDRLKIPNTYAEVSVLMVRWHPDLDEYRDGHNQEIKSLKRIFQQRFGFSVNPIVSLDPRKAKPQNTLNSAIAQHLERHDGANKLMILYYTGHGALVGSDGRLGFAAAADAARELRKDPHSIAYWDNAEKQLFGESVEIDVLTILDCCFASSGHKGFKHSQRTYDLLAACDRNEETAAPGGGSFTQRLISTLDQLLDEEGDQRILTTMLVKEMNRNCETHAHLFDRLKKDDGRVVQLKPLTKQSKKETKKLASELKKQPKEDAGVNLRFSLQDRRLPQKKIEAWAEALINASNLVDIRLRRIDWVKMENNNPGQRLLRVVDAVNQKRKLSPKRRFQQAINTVIVNNRMKAERPNKRSRSKDHSPSTPKRRASNKLLSPLDRSRSRLMTPESNAGERSG